MPLNNLSLKFYFMKKKNIIIFILAVLAAALLLSVCWYGAFYINKLGVGNNKGTAGVNGKTDNSSSGAEQLIIQDSTEFYQIEAKYPDEAWDINGVMAEFIHRIVAEKQAEWAIGGEEYLQEKEVEEAYPDRPKMTYSFNVSYQAFSDSRLKTVSYVFTVGQYTGGANGNSYVRTFTFDKNGQVDIEKVLNLADYVKNDAGQSVYNDLAISKLIFDQASKDTDVFPQPGMISDGLGLSYLSDDGLTIDHGKCNCDGFLFASNLYNFALTDSGIIFFFDKYDLAPGSSGSTQVELSWEKLSPYLTDFDKIYED